MDPRAVITMSPTEAQAAAGGQARFTFAVIERRGVAYAVASAVSSWCRLLLPVGQVGRGELVVDVPDDAGPGRYLLRLVATASGQEIAAANVMLRIAGDRRPGGELCLKVLPRPKFDLQPDGSIVVSLQVVNCGNVDATLVLRAHHEDGWSFSIDEPQLIVGVQNGPITVKVTLRPAGHGVDHGDEITVEVNAGTGWQPVRGRVPRRLWPWAAAAAAVVVAVGVAAAALASQDESDDNVAVTDDELVADGTTVPPTTATEPATEPVQIESFSVVDGPIDSETNLCPITARWSATGDSNGRLELYRDGELVETLRVGNDAQTDGVRSGSFAFVYELKAFDAAGTQTDSERSEITFDCIDID
jgi:hypothetical protein